MKKQKTKTILLAVIMVMVFALTGCGGSSDDSSSDDSSSSESSVSTGAKEGYSFTSGSVKIQMGADASEIVEALGDSKDYFESESCAFEGLDKVYTYPGFKLNTYPVDEKDYVLSVVFMDDTVETEEGIMIGSTKEEVTEAYGDPAEESDTEMVYEKGETTLTIGIDGDKVSTIEIAADVEK